MSHPASQVPFRKSLEARRQAIVRAVAASIQASIERYRDVPEPAWLSAVDGVVAVFLSALDAFRPEEVRRWSRERMERSRPDDFSLSSIMRAISIARDELMESAREGVSAGSPGAWEAVLLFAKVHDVISESLVEHAIRRSEAASREKAATEAHYRDLYLRTPVMMHSIDPTGSLLTVSDKWLETLGYAREEVLGKKSAEFMTESSRRFARETGIPTLEREGFLWDAPCELVSKGGEIVPVLLSAIADRDEAGNIARFIAVAIDVRDRLRAEKALRESEERFRLLVELAPLGFAVHRGGSILYANPAAAKLLGASSPEDLVGMKILDFVHPSSRTLVLERVHRMAQLGEQMPAADEVFQRLDGTLIHVESTAAPIMFEGAPAIQVAVLDVTERKKSEEALRRAAVQEQVIRSQEATLRALATPLIPVGEGVLVMPLIGAVDEGRAKQILEALLAGVAAHRATAAIIDVTGVPDLATEVADGLLRAARAVRLLGARAVLTGLSPAIAQSLAAAGVDLGGLTTRATLRDGIAHAAREPAARSGRGSGEAR
jgi:rsbT co-antagonist protein RsbR